MLRLPLQPNVVYEEIRDEDRRSRAPPVEVSSALASAKFTNTKAAESTDDYSLITAATPEQQVRVRLRPSTGSGSSFSFLVKTKVTGTCCHLFLTLMTSKVLPHTRSEMVIHAFNLASTILAHYLCT